MSLSETLTACVLVYYQNMLVQFTSYVSQTSQVIFSMADEYVPEYVDKKSLVERYLQSDFSSRLFFFFCLGQTRLIFERAMPVPFPSFESFKT